MSQRPLEGKLILDLTNALAGPYATLLLAGLGARVVKVENPITGGDSSRGNAPYVTEDGLRLQRSRDEDMSLSMMLRGRGKESITINLKSEEGRALLLELVEHADALVENFSAGVTRRLGIDYAVLSAVNPRLVYTSISGFGSQGLPGGDKAMDTIIQAMSGMMMTAGFPDDPPVRLGVPVADLVTPLYAVIGTLAALLQAEHTGVGQHVDVSMLGTITSLVACEPFDALEEVGIPLRTGPHVPRLAPFGTFATSDGWVAVCAPTNTLAHNVLRAIGRPDLVDDDRFSVRDQRVTNSETLHALIAAWSIDLTTADAMKVFQEYGVPAGPVRDTAEAVRDPLVLARGEVVKLDHGLAEGLDIYGSGIPILMSGTETSLDRPAPRLGEHTSSILQELLGYGSEKVDALRGSNAL